MTNIIRYGNVLVICKANSSIKLIKNVTVVGRKFEQTNLTPILLEMILNICSDIHAPLYVI